MTAEAGHAPNRQYVDQAGNIHLNGASLFDASENAITALSSATELVAGASGTAGDLVVYPATASKGKTKLTASDNSGDTTTAINTAAQAGARTYTVPDAGGSCAFLMGNLQVGASTAAAGSTVSNAGALPAGTGQVYPTTAADGTKGVVVDAADKVTGRVLFIGNGVSNAILKVYGPSGAVINGASADAAFSSASGKGVILVCLSGAGNTWLAW